MTILAVDDEEMMRSLIASILRDNGFNVLTADCSTHAMSVFREHAGNIDLLITDVVMPGMDGPTLAAALRTVRPDLPVLLISGYCEPEHLAGGFEFLSKPFSLSDMLSKVRALLESHGHRRRRAPGNSRRREPQLAVLRAS